MSTANLAKNVIIPNHRNVKAVKGKVLSHEDMTIVNTLGELKSNLEFLHNNLNHVTDSVLIDSYVYEIKAVHMKYQYYLKLCKERGIIGGGFN